MWRQVFNFKNSSSHIRYWLWSNEILSQVWHQSSPHRGSIVHLGNKKGYCFIYMKGKSLLSLYFTLSSLCEAKEESFQASQRCQTLFSSPQLCIPWPSRLLEKLNYSNTIVSRQLSKLFTLSWSTVIFWGFTINQDKQHVMKTTAVCIKDAFQNKSFLVNTGLYVYIYHNNLSSGSKSYHFTCWDLYFTYSFSTVLILSWNSNPSNWLFTEDTHCF